jgi:hypothetical protein
MPSPQPSFPAKIGLVRGDHHPPRRHRPGHLRRLDATRSRRRATSLRPRTPARSGRPPATATAPTAPTAAARVRPPGTAVHLGALGGCAARGCVAVCVACVRCCRAATHACRAWRVVILVTAIRGWRHAWRRPRGPAVRPEARAIRPSHVSSTRPSRRAKPTSLPSRLQSVATQDADQVWTKHPRCGRLTSL